MAAAARFDLKLDADEKDLLEQESRITLSAQDFQAFSAAIHGSFAPNPALQKALADAARVKRA